jgi:CDP-glucose 4,6-dehydratase
MHADGVHRIDGDVRDTSALARIAVEMAADTVIHLAAQSTVGPAIEDPAETFSHNIEGSWGVLEMCRANPSVTSIVVASSDKAYGDWSGRPYREDMALRARHPYDVSKAAADLLAQSYAATFGLPVAITRCGNLFGGGDVNWSRLVPGTIRSVLEGSRPVIRSDGTPVRDYLYVEDAAEAILTLASHVRTQGSARGEAFNFAGRDRLSAAEVARTILELMDSDLELDIRAMQLAEIPDQRLATTKARRVLGWAPATKFADGLSATIHWYRENLSSIT